MKDLNQFSVSNKPRSIRIQGCHECLDIIPHIYPMFPCQHNQQSSCLHDHYLVMMTLEWSFEHIRSHQHCPIVVDGRAQSLSGMALPWMMSLTTDYVILICILDSILASVLLFTSSWMTSLLCGCCWVYKYRIGDRILKARFV